MEWMRPLAALVCQFGYFEQCHSLTDAASFRIILSSARSDTAFRNLADSRSSSVGRDEYGGLKLPPLIKLQTAVLGAPPQ
jgi:hypothetical protein